MFLKNVPIPIAGVALGTVALGTLLGTWSLAAQSVCCVVAAVMIALLLAKIVRYPQMIRDDLNNSIMASVSGTLFMTLMQLAAFAARFLYVAAFVLWVCAVIGHLVLIVWFTLRFIRRFKLPEVFPTYFICYVGIIVASVTSPAFHQEGLGTCLLWFGFTCYIALFGIVTYRYAKHEIPEGARPLFCIYAAPMSLSLVGYLAVSQQPSAVFVAVLLVLAQILLLFVVFHLPKFMRLDFYPSFAAMTFPFVISATALLRSTDFLASLGALAEPLDIGLSILVVVETVFAAFMVVFVVGHYVRFFIRELKAPTAPDTLEEERAEAHFAEFFED